MFEVTNKKYFLILFLFIFKGLFADCVVSTCLPSTIFVPRQLSYNPIYENAFVFNQYAQLSQVPDYKEEPNNFIISAKPIYSKTCGKNLQTYFTINHACTNSVSELGAADINSLWFQVIAAPDSYYTSTISFNPVQKTYGSLFYFATLLPHDFAITFNTAIIKRTTNMCMKEVVSSSLAEGEVTGFATVKEALTSPEMKYGRICGKQSRSGFDDLQIKFLKNFNNEKYNFFADIYGLLGIPTGQGSTARFLFEPMVGSSHVQLGVGGNIEVFYQCSDKNQASLYSELKWRYGLKGEEIRSFDLTNNGQWSRYLLLTTQAFANNPYFAINDLTFQAEVTPRSSVDFLIAENIQTEHARFEVGYNIWYRQKELVSPCVQLASVGIADLVNIAQLQNSPSIVATTASKATIAQGVYPNEYQMASDGSYTVIDAANINNNSGAQQSCLVNAVFAGLGFVYKGFDCSFNGSYEITANRNFTNSFSIWANLDWRF